MNFTSLSLTQLLEISVSWLSTHGLKILIILLGALIVQRAGQVFIKGVVKRAVKRGGRGGARAEKKRETTLIQIFNSVLTFTVWALVIMLVLSEIGLEIGPILAAAGVFGLAIGFGAQYLIRDFISGIFIIFENQYRVGDVVKIGNLAGTVIDVTLRLTTLRDINGTVHHIPNGQIKTVSNVAKEFGKVNFDVDVAYGTDLDLVERLVNKIGKDLAAEKEWREMIAEAPHYTRLTKFGEYALVFKVLGKTSALKQWAVAGEMRKRILRVFNDNGIEIPYPHMVVRQAREPDKK